MQYGMNVVLAYRLRRSQTFIRETVAAIVGAGRVDRELGQNRALLSLRLDSISPQFLSLNFWLCCAGGDPKTEGTCLHLRLNSGHLLRGTTKRSKLC